MDKQEQSKVRPPKVNGKEIHVSGPIPYPDNPSPEIQLVRQASNPQEMQNAFSQLMLLETYPPQAMQILATQAIQLLKKLQAHNAELESRLAAQRPLDLRADEQTKLQNETRSAPLPQLTKTVVDLINRRNPAEMPMLNGLAMGMLQRIGMLEQAKSALEDSMRSQTNMESEVKAAEIGRQQAEAAAKSLEIERNTLVEALRIACSGGKINPVEEGRSIAQENHHE